MWYIDDRKPTDIEWRYTESGERVRVSVKSGRIIPLPSGAKELDDLVNPTTYEGLYTLLWFLPCNAMRKKAWSCLSPGICLSRWSIYYMQTAEDIIKLLSRPSSPIILVFWSPAPIPNSKGNPFSGVQNTRGWEHFAIFFTEITIYLWTGTR